MAGLIRTLVRQVKKFTQRFSEKPEVTVEDYDLEHFLLYHGLVGSAPENQRQYRDVRADITEAVNHNSSSQMAIALKLQPLLWEHRLQKIFAELSEAGKKEAAIRCLLALEYEDTINVECDPLRHGDWRVRANAAKMLGFLKAGDAVRRMSAALDACMEEHKPAFCHIAYALADVQCEESKAALVKHLYHEEPWFRVDCAGALAAWSLKEIGQELMQAVLHQHRLTDYMAVAIYRRHRPAEILDSGNEELVDGACEMVLGLVQALTGPFHAEQAIAGALEECADRVNITAGRTSSPRRLHAAIALNSWLAQNDIDTARYNETLSGLDNVRHREAVSSFFKKSEWQGGAELGELKHALALAGEFNLDVAPNLVQFLKADFPLLDAIIEALGKLGAKEAAPRIIEIVNRKVNVIERAEREASAQPVAEKDAEEAVTYWTALGALGRMPVPAAAELLSTAVDDFAPDKREQALLSLQQITLSEELRSQFGTRVVDIIGRKLSDSSSRVCIAALQGVASHNAVQHIDECFRLLYSSESSLQRESLKTLSSLADNGHGAAIAEAVQQAMNKENNGRKKERLNLVLREIGKTSS